MKKEFHTDVLYGGKVLKGSNVMNVYGLIDELVSSVHFVSFYMKDIDLKSLIDGINVFLYSTVISDFSAMCYGHNDKIRVGSWNEMSSKIHDCVNSIKSDNNSFVFKWNNHLCLWLNESRVRSRCIERYIVEKFRDVNAIELIVDFFNLLSNFFFEIGVSYNSS